MPSVRKGYTNEVHGLRVASLGAVGTNIARTINEFSFDPNSPSGMQGGLNADALAAEIPRCLCGDSLPKFSTEVTRLRAKTNEY